jgi:3-oxoacyl-[acyl-carrier-protein] synthase-3
VSARIVARPARYARLLGVGKYLPARVVTNDEICEWIESSDEWIRERSGIESRHYAAEDESVVDMAAAAAGKALAHAGLSIDDIGSIVVATVTHPYQTPSAAALVADRLGTTTAGAFDVAAACAGFSYGIGLADGIVRSGQDDHVLVIGVEKLTDYVARDDRGTSFLFADGAGAVVVGPSDEPGIGPTVWGADGGQAEAIIMSQDWVSYRRTLAADPGAPWPILTMSQRWPAAVRRWLRAGGGRGRPHPRRPRRLHPAPANMRITDAMRRPGCPSTSSSPATSRRRATPRRLTRWPWRRSTSQPGQRQPAALSSASAPGFHRPGGHPQSLRATTRVVNPAAPATPTGVRPRRAPT